MREQTKYRGLRIQILVMIVIGVAFSLQHVGTYYLLGEVGQDVYQPILLHVMINVAIPFLVWLVSTFLIVFFARYVTGRLLMIDIFRLSGWALLPLAVSGLLRSAGRLYALQDADQPELGLYSQLGTEWNEYRAYLETANSDIVFIAATIVAAIFVLCAGYLLTTAIEEIGEADGIDVNQTGAAILSSILVVLCLAWLLIPFTF